VRGLQLVAADLDYVYRRTGVLVRQLGADRAAGRQVYSGTGEEHTMARQISRHARYRLAAAAFAVSGGLWCLGALVSGHGMTLLVVGMLNFAASMLIMSLRPQKELCTATVAQCEGCCREERDVGISVHRIDVEGCTAGAPGDAERGTGGPEGVGRRSARESADRDRSGRMNETLTDAGAVRPRERKNRTWSI
jgi:hypothetical protein